MRRARRTLLLVGAGVLALAAAGCAEPEPEPEPLSMTRAAEVYLAAVCPVNEAWDAADVELDRLRLAATREDANSTAAFAEAMSVVAERSGAAASSLASEERAWPAEAEGPVAAVAETLAADREQASRVAALPAEDLVAYRWDGADDVGATAAEARAALGLPDDAAEACAAWRASGEEAAEPEEDPQ